MSCKVHHREFGITTISPTQLIVSVDCVACVLSMLVCCRSSLSTGGLVEEVFPQQPRGLSRGRLGLLNCSAFDCWVVASTDITCVGVPAPGVSTATTIPLPA